jgi:hypothetical protein
MLGVALSLGTDGRLRYERRPFVQAVEELFEEARLLDLDRDVVDAAAVVVVSLALDGDVRGDSTCPVGKKQVFVGGGDVQSSRYREEDDARDDEAHRREEAGHDLRI